MVILYKLQDTGEEVLMPDDSQYSSLTEDGVFIIVDEKTRKIFIWKGLSAPVRQKFISARTASKIRNNYGMVYKVDSIDQGEEPSDFFENFGISASEAGTQSAQPSGPIASARPANVPAANQPSAPVQSARPAPVQSARPAPVQSARPAPVQKETPQPTPQPSVQPAPQPTSKPTPQPTPQTAPAKKVQTQKEFVVSSEEVSEDEFNEVVEKIKELDEPEGMQREIVIIRNKVYSCTKEFHKLFKKEIVRLDKMDDLPDGAFPASDYYTRLFLKDGKVSFVELFSEIPRTERDEFLSEVRSSLRDLTKLGI